MLNVGCQPNDRVISHWQDASSTGTLRSACATDSPSMQNHLPDYSELHILRQWDHSFSHNNQFIRTPWLTLVALAKLAWVCVPSREQYERQNTPPSLPLTRRHYWTKIDDTPWVSHFKGFVNCFCPCKIIDVVNYLKTAMPIHETNCISRTLTNVSSSTTTHRHHFIHEIWFFHLKPTFLTSFGSMFIWR